MLNLFKKISKYISLLVIIILFIPVLGIVVLQIPRVQNFAVEKVVTAISQKVGSSVSFSNVRITTLSRIRFDNLLVIGVQNDTILFSKKTIAVIPIWKKVVLKDKSDDFFIRKLLLDQADLTLAIDSLGILNFQFLIDYIEKGVDTTIHTDPVPFGIKDIRITDSRYFMRNASGSDVPRGINFADLALNEFNVHVQDLLIFADTVDMDIERITFIDKSGFRLENMEAKMQLCSSHLFFDEVSIQTSNSEIRANKLRMAFDSFRDFGSATLFRKIKFDMEFKESKVNTGDIGYFAAFFWGEGQEVLLNGQFKGPLGNFKSNNLRLQWGNSSLLTGDFTLNGLPAIDETFLVFDLSELSTNTADITSLKLPGGLKLTFPENLKKIESIKYSGNFTGFFNDFVAHGRLNTNLGEVYTDLSIVPDTLNSISFSGKIKTAHFLLGTIIGKEELLGAISVDMQIDGSFSKNKPLEANIDGTVSELFFNNYNYRNISIDGEVTDKRFSGLLQVKDPNLSLEFMGLIDLGVEPWLYDFKANVIDANLFALQLSESDTNFHASFLLNAKAQGSSLDNLNGEIRLVNSLFSKTDKQIQVYDLSIFTSNTNELNEIIIRSDLLDADVTGKYQVSKLKDEFIKYLSYYLPALTKQEGFVEGETLGEQVNFDIELKHTRPFFDFFFPEIFVGENSSIGGVFIPGEKKLFKANFISPEVKIGSNSFKNLIVNMISEDSVLNIEAGSRLVNLNGQVDFDNLTLQTSTKNNKIEFSTRWINWDTTVYKGNISGGLLLSRTDSVNTFNFSINPSSFTISDSVWSLNAFKLRIDPSGIFVDNLRLSHKQEYMVAVGKLSDKEGDSLRFGFHNFDMRNLNFLTSESGLHFEGALNGDARLTGNGQSKLFFSTLAVSDLAINGEEMGNLSINSIWDNARQALNIDATSNRGNLTVLRFEGDYFPNLNGKIDFTISLNKLRTNLFNPFVSSIFSDMIGLVSGNLELTGTANKPSLEGKLVLHKNYLTINYLKTRYNFSTEVNVVNNNFLLEDIEIFDPEGNSANLSGVIQTNYLKNISLNLTMKLNNLLCLNTRENDNEMFYGTAYSTGFVYIKGPPSDLKFDIDARTGRNTRFFIPVTENSEVEKYNYIRLILPDSTKTADEIAATQYKVDLSGIQLNFNLDVTPDAEVQLIFDSKMGDIIKAQGAGKMKMSVNSHGRFDLVGEYIIEKGDYLFTLNVINKRLSIESGSTLRWTGDPLNAQVDITAVYRTKASLSDLDPSDTDPEMQQRVTVDCKILLGNQLMSPTVKYDIDLPYTDENIRANVLAKISTEEEKSRQILYLLMLGKFYPTQEGDVSSSGNIAGANASELLSNQLSNWLSQISNDVDFNVNYRPKSGQSSSEVEIAMSTQLLNNKLSINGSVDMKSNAAAENASNVVGDVDIDYKLNKRGNLRLRAYNHSNDYITTDNSPYTQGFGMYYSEEFNTFSELMIKYREFFSRKNIEKNKAEKTETE